MFGLYKDEYMSPYYNFHFNKKSSEDLIWLIKKEYIYLYKY
jgi:hypothetical protein